MYELGGRGRNEAAVLIQLDSQFGPLYLVLTSFDDEWLAPLRVSLAQGSRPRSRTDRGM